MKRIEASAHMLIGAIIGYASTELPNITAPLLLLLLSYILLNIFNIKNITPENKTALVNNATTLLFTWALIFILLSNL